LCEALKVFYPGGRSGETQPLVVVAIFTFDIRANDTSLDSLGFFLGQEFVSVVLLTLPVEVMEGPERLIVILFDPERILPAVAIGGDMSLGLLLGEKCAIDVIVGVIVEIGDLVAVLILAVIESIAMRHHGVGDSDKEIIESGIDTPIRSLAAGESVADEVESGEHDRVSKKQPNQATCLRITTNSSQKCLVGARASPPPMIKVCFVSLFSTYLLWHFYKTALSRTLTSGRGLDCARFLFTFFASRGDVTDQTHIDNDA